MGGFFGRILMGEFKWDTWMHLGKWLWTWDLGIADIVICETGAGYIREVTVRVQGIVRSATVTTFYRGGEREMAWFDDCSR